MTDPSTTGTERIGGGDPAEKLFGETEVVYQCGVAAETEWDPDDPHHFCPHEPEAVELDGPVWIDGLGKVHFPGRPAECPECGEQHDFRFNGVGVFFP